MFLRGSKRQRQRMQTASELGRQRVLHSAVSLQSPLPTERCGNEQHVEMSLPFRPRPGMAGMARTIVLDILHERRESVV